MKEKKRERFNKTSMLGKDKKEDLAEGRRKESFNAKERGRELQC
jgi:hypothetical protein